MSIVTSRFFTFSEIKKESDTTVQNRDIRPGSLQCVFSSLIASATYMLQQRLELLSYSGIAQKAAFWLLMQIRQTGKTAVKIPDSMSRWAMIMNVSRPSFHREMKKLEKDGIIRHTGKIVEVLNPDELQSVLGV